MGPMGDDEVGPLQLVAGFDIVDSLADAFGFRPGTGVGTGVVIGVEPTCGCGMPGVGPIRKFGSPRSTTFQPGTVGIVNNCVGSVTGSEFTTHSRTSNFKLNWFPEPRISISCGTI